MNRKILQKYNRLWAFLLCGVLLLGGCGKADGGGSGAQALNNQGNPGPGSQGVQEGEASEIGEMMSYKDMRYLPEFTDMSEKYGAQLAAGAGFVNDTFYLVKRGEDSEGSMGQLIAYDPGTGEEKVVSESEGMIAAAPLKDGSAILLSAVSDTDYRLSKVDSEGAEIFSREYTDQALYEWKLNARMVADSQDRACLLTDNSVLLFDGQGNAMGKIDLSGKLILQIVSDGSGEVYLYDYYVSQLIPVDFETATLGASAYQIPAMMTLRAIAAGREADFLVCDDTTVYRYSCGDGNLVPLFDLQDSQISNALNIETIGEMEDGRVFIFSRSREVGNDDMEVAVLTPTPLDECPVREVVTIGTVSPGTSLLNSVVEFNRQNEDFNVSILNYSLGGRNYSEARAALKLDISVGRGPDICEIDWLDGTGDLLAKGCFADLSGYLDGSGAYRKEDFISQALDIYSYEGQLMAIPKYFSLRTIAASPDTVGEAAGWDLEDVKAAVQSHPDALVFAETGSSYMIDMCLRNMMGEFVDFEKKEAGFDSPEYIEFLDFLKSLPDNYDDNKSREYTGEWLRDGRALFSVRDIGRLTDFQVLEANFGGSYTCIGYPSPDKSPDCIIQAREAYAITSSCTDKDKAWKFVEWSHSTQGEESELEMMTRSGFPTRKDVFEREMEEAAGQSGTGAGNLGGTTISGSYVKYRNTSPEEIELLRSLIDCAGPEKSMEETILNIMYEETASLFDGSKSAEEVAGVIQNRIQLYLDE
ncbi:MAG TPA: hypothetical protein DCZ91_06970 [Lachnospiraceae bacterium]|nr:hypothetical protein [Lachnospiraceae bacterium]